MTAWADARNSDGGAVETRFNQGDFYSTVCQTVAVKLTTRMEYPHHTVLRHNPAVIFWESDWPYSSFTDASCPCQHHDMVELERGSGHD